MRLLIFTAALLIAANFFAQEHFCGATEVQNAWFAKHPEHKARFDALQRQAELQDQEFVNNSSQRQARTTASAANFTIPVVFHILHKGGSENISDVQVNDAVSILNRDFRKLNPDTNVVVNAFKQIIGDAMIEFRLATKDPNGVCTDGIVRHWDDNTDWSGGLSEYAYTWDPSRYLNIYVVKSINSNAAGYTFLPGSGIPDPMDAIVILSSYVGSIGTGNVGTSRALTHEVGHWLNLPHTWGNTNNPGVACGNDGVSDTPVTKGYTSCNLNNSAICNAGVEENIQNYMDYSYCSRMFTIGQANRMQIAAASTISDRNNLSTPANLFSTGVSDPGTGCSPALDIGAPAYAICSGKTMIISSYTSNAIPTTYAWSADNGATISNPSAPNASVLFNNPGPTIVTCMVSNASGSVTQTVSVNVLNGVTQLTSNTSESFESGVLPANWTVTNATTPTVKWEVTGDGYSFGSKSIYVAGENLPPNSIEILETPSMDFQNNPNAQFYFSYAYARKTEENKDHFKVQASKDCGGTWIDVWTPSNQTLAENSIGTFTTTFIAGNTGWVLQNLINCPPFFQFTNESNVRIRFFFQEDVGGVGYGNRLYLDDINFTSAVGVNEITRAIGLKVYPNPSASAFNIDFTLSTPSKIQYEVVSLTGAVLLSASEASLSEGSHTLTINENNKLANGIYFLNLEMNGVKMSRKLVVN